MDHKPKINLGTKTIPANEGVKCGKGIRSYKAVVTVNYQKIPDLGVVFHASRRTRITPWSRYLIESITCSLGRLVLQPEGAFGLVVLELHFNIPATGISL